MQNVPTIVPLGDSGECCRSDTTGIKSAAVPSKGEAQDGEPGVLRGEPGAHPTARGGRKAVRAAHRPAEPWGEKHGRLRDDQVPRSRTPHHP